MERLVNYFTMAPINDQRYTDRLNKEIEILENINMVWFIERFINIFNLHIRQNSYMLRGSAGSSLLLYYLGVNTIDPIKHNIPLARFINRTRMVAPDIDIDLPLNQRDRIIENVVNSNDDATRMSSNHDQEDNPYFEDMIKEDPTSGLIHSSGVIIYTEDQKDTIEKFKVTPKLISLTKNNYGDHNLKKIDLLSNTALEQLEYIKPKVNYKLNYEDMNIYNYMLTDDGVGVTYAETPAMQYVIKHLKPTNIEQFSICLALIRPFACDNINKRSTWETLKTDFIFDDDVILYLVNELNYDEDEADKIRRLFKKNTEKLEMFELSKKFIEMISTDDVNKTKQKYKFKKALYKLPKYSFCKAHALSYAKLIYELYYVKYYYPRLFWESTIKNIKGYYKEWVYIRKGLQHNLKFKGIKKCDPFYHFIYTGYWLNSEFMTKCYLDIQETKVNHIDDHMTQSLTITESIVDNENNATSCENNESNESNENYEEQPSNELDVTDIDNYHTERDMYRKNISNNNSHEQSIDKIQYNKKCSFRGLIAGTSFMFARYKKAQTVITMGYDNNKFIDLYLNKKRDLSRFKQIIGEGYYIDSPNTPHIIITRLKIF
jgi:hypothetical protein